MFFKILKKDLKRKKSMNIILFLFMIIIGMLVASSTSILYTVTTALDNFMDKANYADLIVFTQSDDKSNKKLDDFGKNSVIEDMSCDQGIYLENKNLTGGKKYTDIAKLTLTSQAAKYNLLFNNEDKLLNVNDNEIAVPISVLENKNLKLGDNVTIKIGNLSKTLKIKYYVKDVALGPNLVGIKRLIVSSNNFNYFNEYNDISKIKIYSFKKKNNITYNKLYKELSKTYNSASGMFTKNLINQLYIMDLAMAGIMIFISIFLMLIAFLILRFTIVFTLREEYKEIGIMKAIGLKSRSIGNLYLVKYLFLSLSGCFIGLLLSFPLSDNMLKSISKNIIITKSPFTIILDILSIIFVITVTLIFCMLCTRKINKFSAIDAIRNGSNGERFSNTRNINLNKHKKLSVPFFMAISDLINDWRKFIIVTITFILGTNLILVPINLINTINSDSMLQYFNFGKSDVFIALKNEDTILKNNDLSMLLNTTSELQDKYSKNNCSVKLHPECYIKGKAYTDNTSDTKIILGLKSFNYSTSNYVYSKGSAPKLENEVAISTYLAQYFNLSIGDKIHCVIGDKTYDFIVTALFDAMTNLGYSVRFSDKVPLTLDGCFSSFICGTFTGSNVTTDKLKKITPDIKIQTRNEYISETMGNISDQLDLMKYIVLTIILGINILITVLIVKMLLSREFTDAAILKSIGFKNKTIKWYHTLRFSIVAFISTVIGTLTSKPFGQFFSSLVFKNMGLSSFKLYIIPFEVYFMYPLIILIATMLACTLSLGKINKINVYEINNQE